MELNITKARSKTRRIRRDERDRILTWAKKNALVGQKFSLSSWVQDDFVRLNDLKMFLETG
jgi:hypothetical protein